MFGGSDVSQIFEPDMNGLGRALCLPEIDRDRVCKTGRLAAYVVFGPGLGVSLMYMRQEISGQV